MALNPAEQSVPDITCREVAEWTSAYLDAHVDDATKVRMALHLAACAGCETYVKQIASVRDMLGLLPRAGASPAQRDRLRQAFSARQAPPPSKT
jgi:predicted anti-sigma-YlaC factor YlaD